MAVITAPNVSFYSINLFANNGSKAADINLTIASSPTTTGGSTYLVTGISGHYGGNSISSLVTTGSITPSGTNIPSSSVTNLIDINSYLTAYLKASTTSTPYFLGFNSDGTEYYLAGYNYNRYQEMTLYKKSGSVTAVETVYAYNIYSNARNFSYSAPANLNSFQGTALKDTITGTSAGEVINGLAGDDTITGGGGRDTIDGGDGNDTISSCDSAELIYGGAGNDTIKGINYSNPANIGVGNDTIDGGTGIDTYMLPYDSFGYDDLEMFSFDASSQTYSLGLTRAESVVSLKNIEKVSYRESKDVFSLVGGTTGSDTLTGASGVDVIFGDAGNDTLNGGASTDYMRGGAGNDTYYVDSINDSILENQNEGTDIVYSTTSFTLEDNLENLTLTGGAAINGTGNSANNLINGNSGNNILNGGSGNDTIVGGTGNDTYYVDSYTYAYNGSSGDVVTESSNAGTDTVIFSASGLYFQLYDNVENFRKQGASKISMSGNALNNSISGGIGDDTISGGAGSDTLTGGAGNDVFNFQYTNESPSNKKDTITDFKSGSDKISLLFSLSSISTLDAVVIVKNFTGVAGQVTFSSGLLSIDTDGNKSADFQVSLTGVKTLLASDIQVIPLG